MTKLLVIIYAAFISLGLPDSLLGSAWPSMYGGFGVSVSRAGLVFMIIAGGTIVSSLSSDMVTRKLGVGAVTLASVALTAVALLAMSLSASFVSFCLWAVPLGLGAGSVDAALNNFVALHYKASHMNWLHCFWGIGASIGPIIMSFFLARPGGWPYGYRTISIVQFSLTAILLASLPLWKIASHSASLGEEARHTAPIGILPLFSLAKARPTLAAFFCYGSLEATAGLWSGTYFVVFRHIPENIAARWVSLFFIGITLGRFLSGFLSMVFSQRLMIRLGQTLVAVGAACLILSGSSGARAGLFCIGLGCAPIYPSLLHETPNTFGKARSQSIMGVQMASAYIGSTFMPPLFGLLASRIGYGVFPMYLSFFLIFMIVMVGQVYHKSLPDERVG